MADCISVLDAISPIDGRYRQIVSDLGSFYSEKALIRYRILVEIEYLIQLIGFLKNNGYGLVSDVNVNLNGLRYMYDETTFDVEEARKVKALEKSINHDVKAVEYYIKEKMDVLAQEDQVWKTAREFVHFGLTSQDINNVAIPLMIRDSMKLYYGCLETVVSLLRGFSKDWIDVSMLSKTHGQPATPTSLGKEIYVWVYRLDNQITFLKKIPHSGKFGGATGQFNAHYAAFPSFDWIGFSDSFLNSLGLIREVWTTQISNYDNLATLFDNLKRINVILIDMCRDIWQYNSMGYFKQKIIATEVGSSAMPHKVNPIDFENAEGNLGIANAIFEFLSSKLPISRLQRDLTDSTVLRNVGVPLSHTIIALKSIAKGLNKLVLNEDVIKRELTENFIVVSEAIQTILRREGYPNPYETLKALTRVDKKIDDTIFKQFVQSLDIEDSVKSEIMAISPLNYIGKYPKIE